MNSIELYTDGSCSGNPGPGGWAFVAVKDGKIEVRKNGAALDTTNNRMEMQAIIEALNFAHNKKFDDITVYSDSSLIVNTLTKNWKRKKNTDLWEEIDRARIVLNEKKVSFIWVKGHAENKFNNEADKLAVEATMQNKKKKGEFYCKKCNQDVEQKYTYLQDSHMVKACCKKCDTYLKFVAPTQENIKKCAN